VRARHCAADAIEADAARHLLDQVDLTFEIGPEGGRGRDEGVAVAPVVEIDAERRQRVPHFFGVERGAEHVIDAARAHPDPLGLDRVRVHVLALGCDLRTGDVGEQLHRPLGIPRDRIRVDAALEASARLAPQLQPLRRTRDSHRLEVRGLEEDLARGVGDLGRGPTHDPGDRLRRALGVTDEEIGRSELSLHTVERRHALPVAREPHDDAAPGQLREVERVQGLVALEQHVVGDVDDVADRSHAGLHQPLHHPRRRLPHRDARDAAEITRAPVERLDGHRDVVGDCGVGARLRLGNAEFQLEVRGEFAGDSHDAHRVGPVGCDGQVEDDVVETEDLAHVGPELARRIETHDPRVIVAEPELTGRQEHAVGDDPADRAALEPEATGQRRARGRVRRDHPGDDVRRSAHHTRLSETEVDVDQRQLVGVGMLHDVEHLAGDDPGDLLTRLLDALDFQPELVQRRDEVGHRLVDRRELADPGQRRAHQYCAKNRTSLSKNVLISSTP
jgi:hypothetical protein